MVTARSIPLDAPLYQINAERGAEYWNCSAVAGIFTVEGDVTDLIPEGLTVASTPSVGMVFVADYGASTLGPYKEFVSFIQVKDDKDNIGLYIPYIYVTNDVALASGREVLGAPKKMADISIDKSTNVIVGELNRPSNLPLVKVTTSPVDRVDPILLDALLPKDAYFYSLRYLPGPPGGTTVSELVAWKSEMAFHKDAFGDQIQFMGPGSVTYPFESPQDPVSRLKVGTMLATAYMEFDLRLKPGHIVNSKVTKEVEAVV